MTSQHVPLEERLKEFEGYPEVVGFLKQSVSGPYVDSQDARSVIGDDKLNLSRAIVEKMQELGITLDSRQHPDFGLNLYHEINKSPLYRVCYGLNSLHIKNKKVVDVLNKLTDYEKAYFLAGVWCKQGEPELIEELPFLVSEYIVAGVNLLRKVYRETHKGAEWDTDQIPGYTWITEDNGRLSHAHVTKREIRRMRPRADIDG